VGILQLGVQTANIFHLPHLLIYADRHGERLKSATYTLV